MDGGDFGHDRPQPARDQHPLRAREAAPVERDIVVHQRLRAAQAALAQTVLGRQERLIQERASTQTAVDRARVQPGDLLEFSGPSGSFIFTGRECKCILLIGGGVGITVSDPGGVRTPATSPT